MRTIGIVALILTYTGCTGESVIDKQENSAPVVVIMSHTDGVEVQDGYVENFRATVSDDDNQFTDLSIAWYVGEEIVCDWSSASPAGDSTCSIVFSEGDSNVVVEVRDPQGAGGRAEISVVVLPTEAPTVSMLTPLGNSNYYSDQLIQFSAMVGDLEDDVEDLIVTWTSSVDGELPLDTSVNSSGEMSDYTYLSEGNHAIEVQVEDSSGKVSTDEVVIRVGGENSVPTCSILEPSDSSAFVVGESIRFRGIAQDADISSLDLQVSWISDKDGVFGSSTPGSDGSVIYSFDNLSANEHTVSLLVEDEVGARCSSVILLAVGNAPTATISSPQNGDIFAVGDTITVRGSVSDTEDQFNEIAVVWSSDVDGVLQSGNANSQGISQFTRSNLSAGIHSISFTATDSSGLVADDLISFRVNNPPVVNSVTLSPNPAYGSSNLSVVANMSDADGHNVTATYAWYEDGVLTSFTGTTINASNVDVGEVWTVRVTPDDGYSTGNYVEESITIANSLPVVSSVSISPSSNVRHNSTLTCSAVTSDADQTVTPSYVWTVNGTSYAGATLNLSTVTVTPGDSILCTATVTDNQGATASSSASVLLENSAPVVSNVTINPSSPSLLDTVTCSASASDIDGGNPTLSFVFSNQSTGATYANTTTTSTSATLDLGGVIVSSNDVLLCTATATDAQGASTSSSTNVTVINAAPVFSQTATISPAGNPTTGTTLTCSASATDPAGGSINYSYSWLLNGQTASTGTTFSVSSSATNVNDTIECWVVAMNSLGMTTTSTSASVMVANTLPVVSSVQLSPGSANTNTTISATASVSDLDADPITATFTWHVIDAISGADNVVSSGSGASYTSLVGSYFDRDDEVYVVVTPNDGHGSGTPVSSAQLTISNSTPTSPLVSVTSTANPPIEGTDDLVCSLSNTPSDLDGDPLLYTYHWYDDAGMLQQTYVGTNATSDTFIGSGTTAGTWTCEIIVSDGTVTSSGSDTIYVDSDWDGQRSFSNCGQTGRTGPAQSQCDSSYAGGTLAGEVTVTSGFQYWTVPSSGVYRILAVGAGEGNARGASIQGDVSLQGGDILKIVIGQQGEMAGGGHGGTFVATAANAPLVVAGGGGAVTGCTGYPQYQHASTSTTGGDGNLGSGGTNGNGGNATQYSYYAGGGGGGFYSNGTENSNYSGKGLAFVNGALGGTYTGYCNRYGGFGGGGCGYPSDEPAGGGGYSGGGGGGAENNGSLHGSCRFGGGGASYNSGSNPVNTSGVNSGHGYVTIDKL